MAIEKDIILNVINEVTTEIRTYEFRGQLTVTVPKDKIVDVARSLKSNPATSFSQLMDITAIDWNRDKARYEVVYFLYSLELKARLRLKTEVDESDLNCPTMTDVYTSANWYERETYDMFGINFTGHPNLRRFYMPEDYKDPETGEKLYPLRKDFPLMGVPDSMPLPPYPEKYGELT